MLDLKTALRCWPKFCGSKTKLPLYSP